MSWFKDFVEDVGAAIDFRGGHSFRTYSYPEYEKCSCGDQVGCADCNTWKCSLGNTRNCSGSGYRSGNIRKNPPPIEVPMQIPEE